MGRRRRRSKDKFFNLTAILSGLFIYPLTLLPNDLNLPLVLIGGMILFIAIVLVCQKITKSGKNKTYKEAFNAIWNMETAIVFTVGIFFYFFYQREGKKAPDLINPFIEHHPYISSLIVVILISTVIFRFGLSLTDLLVKPDVQEAPKQTLDKQENPQRTKAS